MTTPASIPTSQSLWDAIPAGPRRLLAIAAATEFGARGYHATTTRDIAAQVGMSPAGLYAHYHSKADLLFMIARTGLQSIRATLEDAIAHETSPEQRVRIMVKRFTEWHTNNATLARVLQYELLALEPTHLRQISEIRHDISAIISKELARASEGPDLLSAQTQAVLSLAIDTARWFSPEKSMGAKELGDEYATLVVRMLRDDPA